VHCAVCKPFTICLPFGGVLSFDGRCLSYSAPQDIPPDGEYTLVEVKAGCFVAVGHAPDPSYIAPPCEPEPEPCEESDIVIDPDPANLSGLTSAGALLTKLFHEQSGIAVVTGDGTVASPLTISVPAQIFTLVATSSTPDALEVSGAGTSSDPLDIKHKLSSVGSSAAGFTLDPYGHVVAYIAPDSFGVISVNSTTSSITVANNNGAVFVDLPLMGFESEKSVETFDSKLTVDLFGRIKTIQPKTPEAVSEKFWRFYADSWSTISFNFVTNATGTIRATLKGDLGLSLTGYGLLPLPSGVTVTLNSNTMQAYVLVDNDHGVGLDIFNQYLLDPGEHVLAITLPNTAPGPAILDVSLCQ
jgi:hypothetical protein